MPRNNLIRITIFATIMAVTASAANALDCRIVQKCGLSGMCVTSNEDVTFAKTDTGALTLAEGHAVVDITLRDGGEFHMVQVAAAHGEGQNLDPMAATFAGFCKDVAQ